MSRPVLGPYRRLRGRLTLRALHEEITLTRPRMGFHSGMRSSCEYASKHASAGSPMVTLRVHLSVTTRLGALARVAASEVVAARAWQLDASRSVAACRTATSRSRGHKLVAAALPCAICAGGKFQEGEGDGGAEGGVGGVGAGEGGTESAATTKAPFW